MTRQVVVPGAAIVTEGARSFFVSTPMLAVESDHEVAWEGAKELVSIRHDWGWCLSRFVSFAPIPNQNGHIFGLEDAGLVQTVRGTPLNMGHAAHYIVGSNMFHAIVYPTEAATATDAEADGHPWAEVLSNFYRGVFPEEYQAVHNAQKAGSAFISMEAVPQALVCMTDGCCGAEYAYYGLRDDSYCDSLNKPASRKKLKKPWYIGAGVILPPQRPGWRGADLATLASAERDEADRVLTAVTAVSPHLSTLQAQAIMAELMSAALMDGPSASQLTLWAAEDVVYDRRFSQAQRRSLYERHQALPDLSYPIETVSDLRNAIRLARSGHGNVSAAKALIVRMARRFGRTDLVPQDWKVSVDSAVDAAMPFGALFAMVDKMEVDAQNRAALEAAVEGVFAAAGPEPVPPAPAAAAELAVDTGVIVCLVPPEPVRKELAALGTEPEEEIHVTLAFLGDDKGGMGTLTDPVKEEEAVTLDRLVEVVRTVAAGESPLHATVSGLGRFSLAPGSKSEVTYASVDCPGLPQLFTRLAEAMDAAGIPRSRLHGVSPHCSLAYTAAGKGPTEMPPTLEWEVTSLWIWWADQRVEVPIGV